MFYSYFFTIFHCQSTNFKLLYYVIHELNYIVQYIIMWIMIINNIILI